MATAAQEPLVDRMTSAMAAAEVPLNDRIWWLLRTTGLAHQDLASRLGISQSGVSRRLSGEVAWRVNELDILAQCLGLPLSQLLGVEPSAVSTGDSVSAAPSTGVRRRQISAGPTRHPKQPSQVDVNGKGKRRKTATP